MMMENGVPVIYEMPYEQQSSSDNTGARREKKTLLERLAPPVWSFLASAMRTTNLCLTEKLVATFMPI